MNVLILGATGMLGHKLLQYLGKEFNVKGTIRGSASCLSNHSFLKNFSIIENVRADDFSSVKKGIVFANADVIINCIGIVKQLPQAYDPVVSITINSLFPHQLADFCSSKKIRLIHYSTDCVFSGKKGNYSENDIPDADDLYGRSKLLGEVSGKHCLTLRTSIIGRELASSHGLIEWFLSQEGKIVKGYKNAFFSGLTTNAHARVLKEIITDHPNLEGLYHLAGDSISKYDLLNLVKDQYNIEITIEPDFQEVSNRSLNSSIFKMKTKILIPNWNQMIKEMYTDNTPYGIIRSQHVFQ